MKSALAAVALLIAAGLPAHSATSTTSITGGTNTYNSANDVIGTTAFDITSADVTRSGPGNGTLTVAIHTNYAGVPGTTAAEGTGYGSLFFSTSANGGWSPTGSAPYPTDQYVANDWNYAFTMPTTPNVDAGNSALYAIGRQRDANNRSARTNVVQSLHDTERHDLHVERERKSDHVSRQPAIPASTSARGRRCNTRRCAPVNATAATGTWTVDAASRTRSRSPFSTAGLLGNEFRARLGNDLRQRRDPGIRPLSAGPELHDATAGGGVALRQRARGRRWLRPLAQGEKNTNERDRSGGVIQ